MSVLDLNEVFTRIAGRLSSGYEGVEIMLRYYTKRMELEDKWASTLKSIIPEKYDKKDPIQVLVFKEAKNEYKNRRIMSEDLEDQVDILKAFLAEIKESKKPIDKVLSKHTRELNSLTKDVERAQAKLEAESQKMLKIEDPKKKSQQFEYVQKCGKELEAKSVEKSKFENQIISEELPKLQTDFDAYDSKVQNKTRDVALKYLKLKETLQISVHRQTVNTFSMFSSLDVNDLSKRYVSATFQTENQNPEKMATYAIAISEYNSEYPQDLKFKRGDKIRITNKHSSGWWDGELNGKIGLFPSNFVILDTAKPLADVAVYEMFECITDFRAIGSDEIDILLGDFVYVETIQHGTCTGWNLRTGKHGTFPFKFIDSRF